MIWEINGVLPRPVRDRCNSRWSLSSGSFLQWDELKIKSEWVKMMGSTSVSGATVSILLSNTLYAKAAVTTTHATIFHLHNYIMWQWNWTLTLLGQCYYVPSSLSCSFISRVLGKSRGIIVLVVSVSPYSFTSEFHLPKGRN